MLELVSSPRDRQEPLPEQRFLDLTEDLSAIVWESDPHTHEFLYVSRSAERILGYPAEWWLDDRRFLERHVHPEDLETALEQCWGRSLNGQNVVREFRFLSADGRMVWVRNSVRAVHDERGEMERLRGVMWDLSEHKRAEEALKESRQRHGYLVEHASDIIYKTDREGRFTFLNAAAPRILKYGPERLLGLHYLALVRPDYRPAARRFYWRQFRHRTPTTYFELPVITGDGDYLWLGQNVQLVMDGECVVGFQAIARDLTEHKQSEARLLESEERYRIVAETATDAIITIERSSEIAFVNSSVEAIFGYNVKEVIGQSLSKLLPGYPLSFHQRSARLDLGTGKGYFGAEPVELRGRHKDGHEIPLEVTLGEYTERGRHLFTFVLRDITERKRAEEELRRKDQRFRSLIENASDVTAILDREGGILYASPSVARVLGYAPEEITGRPAFDLVHPDGREDAVRAFRRRVEDAEAASPSAPKVLRFRHRNGSSRVLEAVARNLFNDSSVNGLVVNLRDITESQRVQEELRAANEMLRALIQASPAATVAVDAVGLVTMWNPAAEKTFGWKEGEVVGRPVPYVPEEAQAEAEAELQALWRGESISAECVRRTKSGECIVVNLSAAPLRTADGSIWGAAFVITDVTERKRLEVQLRQAQKMEAVGQLAGGVAHDFNNLLTVISGYDQLLVNNLAAGDRCGVYAREIMNAAERASTLTRQLLAFSRRQVGQPVVLDVNALVTNMTKMLRRLIGENIELNTALGPLEGKIHADPGQVEQLILNLVVNARDAMPHGGKLTIETADAWLGDIYVRTHVSARQGHHVLLAVSDTGHGMDEETRRRIFEPFFTTKEVGKGTGLGLSTVYGIVKQNNANVWVYSEPDVGTTFKIYFPAVEAEPKTDLPGVPAQAMRGNETILLVEDEAGLRSLVKELLEQFGYRVLVASGGQQAMEYSLHERGYIHLLLTDVVMPEWSGRQVAERLTRLRPQMRVLYMSGYPDETIVKHGILNPGVAFLQKPFSQDALVAKVRAVLDAEVPVPAGPAGD